MNTRWSGSPTSDLVLSFRRPGTIGDLLINVAKPTTVSLSDYHNIKETIIDINLVINSIIPGLSVKIVEHGQQMTKTGDAGMRFELASIRDDMPIPLRYESEGIRKIISMLHIIVSAYNDSSMLVAIDELDAGVYEYLLGEMLQVFAETGKGQLIFTSHNLRALEVLDKNSIIFTTTNPENRYIPLKYVKTNNNLRDLYLRSILLGGQDEELYSETKMHAIRRAMRKAGEFSK
jgi:hypothetical protein